MSGWIVVAIVLVVLLLMIAIEVPIAFALVGSSLVGMLLLRGPDIVTASLASLPYVSTASYGLTVIPMYVLLGVLALHGRLGDELFSLAASVFRRVPGGVGIATVGASAGFGAVSGSTAAAAVAIGKLSIPRMLSHGYSKQFAGGIASVGGTLDALIPPSIILVIYAVITQTPTGSMLIAGIVPGLLTALFYALYILVRAGGPWRKPVIVPVGATDGGPQRFPIGGLVRAVTLFGVVIGGIYSGFFTPTEAGAFGAFIALVMLAYDFRQRGLRAFVNVLWRSLIETASTTSMILIIIVGAALFSSTLVLSGIPKEMASFISSLDLSPAVFMILVIVVLLPLGMFLESMAILTIVVPFIAPIMVTLGIDPIWAGILIVKAIAIGMITPPVGIIPFIIAGAVRQIKVSEIFRGVIPFVVLDLVVIAVLILFPQIVTGLPSLMRE